MIESWFVPDVEADFAAIEEEQEANPVIVFEVEQQSIFDKMSNLLDQYFHSYTHLFYPAKLIEYQKIYTWYDETAPEPEPKEIPGDLHFPPTRSGGLGGLTRGPRDLYYGTGVWPRIVDFQVPITPPTSFAGLENMIKTVHKPP